MSTNAPAAQLKPGYKTTEFWLTLVAMGLGAVFASGAVCTASDNPAQAHVCQVAGLAAMALSKAGYSVSRGLAKGGQS
jgi:hypothetical protein